MSLLFDENLSFRLVQRLADLFPNATAVELIGMRSASDLEIWDYAVRHQLAIVTRDDDLVDMSILRGHPPKVIRVGLENCSTTQVESLFRWRQADVARFLADPASSWIVLR